MIGRVDDVGRGAHLEPVLVYSQVEARVGIRVAAREEVLVDGRGLLLPVEDVSDDVVIDGLRQREVRVRGRQVRRVVNYRRCLIPRLPQVSHSVLYTSWSLVRS